MLSQLQGSVFEKKIYLGPRVLLPTVTKHTHTHAKSAKEEKFQQIPIITCLEDYVKTFAQLSSLANFIDILLILGKAVPQLFGISKWSYIPHNT